MPTPSRVPVVAVVPVAPVAPVAPATPDQLRQHAIPGIVSIVAGQGGLTRVDVTNSHATAELYLHGAHLTRYQPHGTVPILWMSPQSAFRPDAAIRGGIPICWPWFGRHASRSDLPAHGFARIRPWELVRTSQDAAGRTRIELQLVSSAQTQELWPFAFTVRYVATVGPELDLELICENPGPVSFTCEEALHTYLAVADVARSEITGLAGAPYQDKVLGANAQQNDALILRAETDRVYHGSPQGLIIADPGHGRRLRLTKGGSQTTVVWNPWLAKATAMADIGGQAWNTMLCVESANTAPEGLTIAPGYAHILRTRISWEGAGSGSAGSPSGTP